jgi:hypothetical protein
MQEERNEEIKCKAIVGWGGGGGGGVGVYQMCSRLLKVGTSMTKRKKERNK